MGWFAQDKYNTIYIVSDTDKTMYEARWRRDNGSHGPWSLVENGYDNLGRSGDWISDSEFQEISLKEMLDITGQTFIGILVQTGIDLRGSTKRKSSF